MKRTTIVTLAAVLSIVAAQASQTFIPGILKYERWPGKSLADVDTGNPGTPADVRFLTSFEIPINIANTYSARVTGVFIPPTTGNYVFMDASDDNSILYLGTDATAASKRIIAQEPGWSASRTWTTDNGGAAGLQQKNSSTWIPAGQSTAPYAAGIPLTAGTQYFFQGVMNEGGGGDNFAVFYKLIADADPTDGDAPNTTNNVIGYLVTNPTFLTITAQPQSITVYEGLSASFSVTVSTDSEIPPAYQWRKNGAPIANATASSYSFVTAPGDNNTQFDCVVTIPYLTNTVTSTAATLTTQAGAVTVANSLKQEYFPGKDRVSIETGSAGAPASVTVYTNLESPTNLADNFGRRVSGLFTPAASGNYVFFITSDDDSDLFISTDSSAANKRLVAQQFGWSGVRTWVTDNGGDAAEPAQKRSDQFVPDPANPTPPPYATGIPLTAGTAYYIEAVHHEGGGGDNLAVTYKVNPANPDPVDGDAPKFAPGELSFVTKPVTTLTISSQPQNVNVFEGLAFSLSVGVQTDCELTPLYQWRKGGAPINGANGSTYSVGLAGLADSGQYDCVVTLPGGFAQTATSTAATVTVQQSQFLSGLLKYEYFPNFTRQDVENGVATSVGGSQIGNSTSDGYFQIFQTAEGFADNYANRFSGFFVPPTTGAYVMFVAGDDDSDLYLSTDDKPANKRLVAQVPTWTNSRQWSSTPQQRSDTWDDGTGATPWAAGINLTAGTRYYIEGVHHEGGGGDNFAATFKLVTDPDPVDGDAPKLTGNAIGVLAPKPSTLSITTQPQDVSGYAYTFVSFSIAAQTDSVIPPAYQWRRNGANVNGATGAGFAVIVSPNDSTATFDCVVTIPGFTNTVTSSVAHINVLPGATFVAGSLSAQFFTGKNRQDILNGTAGTPTSSTNLPNFEIPVDVADNYATSVMGFFIPAVSGNYVFFDASDDDSDLYLSTDDQPSNMRLICQEPGWSATRTWTTDNGGTIGLQQKRSDTFVDPVSNTTPYATGIPLVAGTRYFMFGAHHEGGGGDNFAVTFKVNVADADPTDGDAPVFTTAMLGHMEVAAVTNPTITYTVSGGNLNVSWAPAGGRLQSKSDLNSATWNDVGAANPAVVPIGAGNLFLRVQNP